MNKLFSLFNLSVIVHFQIYIRLKHFFVRAPISVDWRDVGRTLLRINHYLSLVESLLLMQWLWVIFGLSATYCCYTHNWWVHWNLVILTVARTIISRVRSTCKWGRCFPRLLRLVLTRMLLLLFSTLNDNVVFTAMTFLSLCRQFLT